MTTETMTMPEPVKTALPRPAPPVSAAEERRSAEVSAIRVETVHLDFFYGKSQALFDVSFAVPERSVTALIGPSGMPSKACCTMLIDSRISRTRQIYLANTSPSLAIGTLNLKFS